AKKVPPAAPAAAAPAPAEAESLSQPGAAGALSGFPASPPLAEDRATPPRSPPAPAAAPSAAMRPRAEMRERSALQDESPAPPSLARNLPGGNAANRDTGAAASPQAHKALDPSLLPRALRDAARTGNTGEVENLIAQGAPVDARDTAGRTALMLAALNGHAGAVQKLLALGAQTSLVDGDGLTAAQHARRWGYSAVADLIDAAR
ncbi:MAG: ankyrin repeat domain-containing protein, partial [Gammaproteobacteria bacterium]|nr:ankyrin repeat domain-containing protein [Gammaproteobacteria bacterium]